MDGRPWRARIEGDPTMRPQGFDVWSGERRWEWAIRHIGGVHGRVLLMEALVIARVEVVARGDPTKADEIETLLAAMKSAPIRRQG
jgi:hypothetical protein